jgi:hypothetical protein
MVWTVDQPHALGIFKLKFEDVLSHEPAAKSYGKMNFILG